MPPKTKPIAKKINWRRPRSEDIELEYKVEYKLHIRPEHGDIFPTIGQFRYAVDIAPVVEVTPSMDKRIINRSHTSNFKQLMGLISNYASYPKYRNEQTLTALEQRIRSGQPISMPIVLKFKSHMAIMGGNTRMDIGFWYAKRVSVLMVTI